MDYANKHSKLKFFKKEQVTFGRFHKAILTNESISAPFSFKKANFIEINKFGNFKDIIWSPFYSNPSDFLNKHPEFQRFDIIRLKNVEYCCWKVYGGLFYLEMDPSLYSTIEQTDDWTLRNLTFRADSPVSLYFYVLVPISNKKRIVLVKEKIRITSPVHFEKLLLIHCKADPRPVFSRFIREYKRRQQPDFVMSYHGLELIRRDHKVMTRLDTLIPDRVDFSKAKSVFNFEITIQQLTSLTLDFAKLDYKHLTHWLQNEKFHLLRDLDALSTLTIRNGIWRHKPWWLRKIENSQQIEVSYHTQQNQVDLLQYSPRKHYQELKLTQIFS